MVSTEDKLLSLVPTMAITGISLKLIDDSLNLGRKNKNKLSLF